MPAIVGTAIIAGAASGAAAAIAGGTFAFSWAAFGASLLLGGVSKALAKSPSRAAAGEAGPVFQAQARNLSVRQPISPWRVWLGEARVGGVLTFGRVSDDRQWLHLVVTYACHPIDGIQEFQLDDAIIAADSLDANGNVTQASLLDASGRTTTAAKYLRRDANARAETVTLIYAGPGTGVSYAYTSYPIGALHSASVYFDDDSVAGWRPITGDVLVINSNIIYFPDSYSGSQVLLNYDEVSHTALLRIHTSLGAESYGTQPFPHLAAECPAHWTAAHRQDGCAKVYYRIHVSVLGGGIPQLSVVGRGLKPYDPRLSASRFSSNVAVAIAAYFTDAEWGLGADIDSELDEDALTAAANVCDERVESVHDTAMFGSSGSNIISLTSGARTPRTGDGVRVSATGSLPTGLSANTTYYAIRVGVERIKLASTFANAMSGIPLSVSGAGSGTLTLTYWDEPRYTINGTFATSERPSEVLERMLGVMAGRAAQVSDRWHIHAGAYEAPTITLDENDFVGPVEINPMPGRNESANGAKGVYIDVDKYWQATDFPAVESDTYLAEDGDEHIWAELDFTQFINSHRTAQRLGKIELRRRRAGLTVSSTFKLSAYRAVTARTVALDFAKYGFSGQAFEVIKTGFAVIPGRDGGAPSLGVRLALRQINAAIFDWSSTEEQAVTLARATALADPFSTAPAAPGLPSLSEEKYETTGSAGVKVRGNVTWEASAGPFVGQHVLEWKPLADTQWRSIAGRGTRAIIDDLSPGWYLLRTYAVSDFSKRGESSGVVQVYVVGLNDTPADVVDFSVNPLGDGRAELSWARHVDLDVRIGGRILLRWSPSITAPTWNEMVPVGGDVAGDARGVIVPHLTGTYGARARDSVGNESENAVTVTTTVPDSFGFNAVESLTAEPTWSGTLTNCSVVSGKLRLRADTTLSEMVTPLSTWGPLSTLGGMAAEGTCALSDLIDLGAVYTSRVTANIETLSFEHNDYISQWVTPMSQWGRISGAEISTTAADVLVATTDDNPSGSPTWSSWRPFVIGDYRARGFKFQVRLRSGNPDHCIEVESLGIDVDMQDRVEGARNVDSGAGAYSVTYGAAYKTSPRIGVTAKNLATGDYWLIANETTSGYDITFKNAGGSAVSRTFDWQVTGY